jgi:hypothetical protein
VRDAATERLILVLFVSEIISEIPRVYTERKKFLDIFPLGLTQTPCTVGYNYFDFLTGWM